MKRFTIIIPMILSIAGFVLAMLSLFAGSKPGQLEDYHIIAVSHALIVLEIFMRRRAPDPSLAQHVQLWP